MRSSLLFAALGGCGVVARASSTSGFVALYDCRGRRASGTVAVVVGGGAGATAAATKATTTTTTTRLLSMPEPIASEGDWSAYLDSESTGYVYYFNGVTGESTWEPPTPTFPPVVGASAAAKSATTTTTYAATTATAAAASVTAVKEDRRTERQRRREQKKAELAASSSSSSSSGGGGGGGGGLFGFFGGGVSREAAASATTAKTQAQQLSDLREIANNDEFLSDLDAVIAEAEEAIAIASRVEEAPPKNKGGFFSSLGFVSGSEAVEEVESLITDAERTLEGVFSSLSLGARQSPKEKSREEVAAKAGPPPPAPAAEENVWVEGLMSLFKNTFDAFIPPPLTTKEMTMSKSTSTSLEKTIKNKKVVVAAIETPEKERKAKVSDSDFLDVIWGAETSARPTLNIKEMMKAFQVRSTEEERPSAEKTLEFRTLLLEAALEVRAHPEKVSWGGEDAGFFVGRTFGVFDGVSGAAKEKGKKLYSRCLADTMKKSVTGAGKAAAAGGGGRGLSVRQITDYLLEAKKLADGEGTGASTAVVASIGEDNVLRALNLGDSVCLVLRDGAVAARTREIVHYFDCPYQLGDDSPDRPSDGTTLQAEIFGGDVIVAGSDGVFDNLSDADVCEIVSSFGARGKSSAIAKKIVDRSRTVSMDPDSVTPYSTVARGKSGYGAYKNGRGGKVDDISCLVVKAS
jgi:protein phosphatase PTC7